MNAVSEYMYNTIDLEPLHIITSEAQAGGDGQQYLMRLLFEER